MKTIKRIFLSVITFCLFSLVLTSCFAPSTKSIKIKQLPNSVFEVGTSDIEKLMIVEVTDESTTEIILSIEDGQLVTSTNVFTVTLNGFDLSKVGSFTASVEYSGVVSYFDYHVVSKDSYFAGGDGSVNNPYQITNAEQFLNMNKVETTNKYFKLMNDIDLSSVTTADNLVDKEWYCAYVGAFSGTLDGNNKKIYNVDDTNKNLGKMLILFAKTTNATIKDVDFYINSEGGISLVCNAYGKINFENVNMFGTCIDTGHNFGTYIIYKWYGSASFVNCDNYVDIIDSDALYVAGFVAYPLSANMYFENSFYYGYMEALKVAAFVCNGSQTGTVKYVDSGNKGTLNSVQELSNVYCAVSQNAIKVDETSTGLVTGTVKQIPAFNFAANTKLVDNKLVINKVAEDSEIVEVKVTLSFRWMKEETNGTNTAYTSSVFDINSNADLETQLYLTSLVNGVPAIKVIYAADYVKGEEENEVSFAETPWLKYNVEQGVYVFDGSKVSDSANYVTYGNPAITIVAYNASGEVVSAVIVDAKVA